MNNIKETTSETSTKTQSKVRQPKLYYHSITSEQAQQLQLQQDNKCGLCGVDLLSIAYRANNLDHDHYTGIVRGKLCGTCNRMLGIIEKENPTQQDLRVYFKKVLQWTAKGRS